MNELTIIQQLMPIAKNVADLMKLTKNLNLDLEFIKKLYYYNKNLEDFLEMRMNEVAKITKDDIKRDIVHINNMKE